MTLAADACGGPNPLVSLANNFRDSKRVNTPFNQQSGSHVIADLLKHVNHYNSADEATQVSHKFETVRSVESAFPAGKQKKSLNQSFSEFKQAHQETSPMFPEPHHNFPQRSLWRPHQRTSCTVGESSKQRHNRNFEDWVRHYHPEVLTKVRASASDVVDVELSHELAERWLRDFHLNDVIQIESITEAEDIVETWIREFRLGGDHGTRLSDQDRLELEKENTEYQYITESNSTTSPDIDMGINMIKQGDLLLAISVFEDVVNQEPRCGEGWYYLGLCHQQSENEEQAISAFNRVEADDMCYPSTLLGLSASYLNENKHHSATDCLTQWLTLCHPGVLKPGQEVSRGAGVLRSLYSSLPRAPDNNVEIHTALGILSCVLGEAHVAAEHFREAVKVSPSDFMLWNRLGACLANSDRSSESVSPYRHALQLSPGYVRARYNLGIACLNLRAYREGIEHFLLCLKQHDSPAVWRTLRLAITLHQRYDLLVDLDKQDLPALLGVFQLGD